MEREKGILQLADYYEKFEVGNSSAYLIINENMRDYKAMFGFTELSDKMDEWKELFHRRKGEGTWLLCTCGTAELFHLDELPLGYQPF